MPDVFAAVRDFVQSGGDVVRLIGLVTFVMWVLILERLWYLRGVHPREVERVLDQWRERADRTSWYAKQIRRALVSEVSLGLQSSLGSIKTLVAICPLLGLLGTVTGMIEVFEVMALTGSSNARAMAAGVSKATIPTMAGMVAALSGLYLSIWLERTARNETARTADRLTER